MIGAETKIRVIERILETDDANLLRDIESLLHQPLLTDYAPVTMTQAQLLAKVEQAEQAAQRGEVTPHEAVRGLMATWKHK